MIVALLLAALVAVPLPPPEYQGDNGAHIVFVNDTALVHDCGNVRADACTRKVGADTVIYAPNPCKYHGWYAEMLCWELGRVNGYGFPPK